MVIDFDSIHARLNFVDIRETTTEDVDEINNDINYKDFMMITDDWFISLPEYNNHFTFFEDIVLNEVPVEFISDDGNGFKIKKEFVVLESDGYIMFKKAEENEIE